MLYTDLRELKTALDINPNHTAEDKKLNFFLEQASEWIGEYLGRPGFDYQSRTEYYNGTGTQQLLLRSRPVYTTPTIQVYYDSSGFYGSTSGSFNSNNAFTYGVDFCLKIDQADGTSRSGILVRINNLWPKPSARQVGLLSPFISTGFGTIKVVYTAGYTVDTLPASFRLACNLLISKMRYVFPLGVELSAESYEDRSIAVSALGQQKNYLMSLLKPFLNNYRNWSF